jgi:hypothetical protein
MNKNKKLENSKVSSLRNSGRLGPKTVPVWIELDGTSQSLRNSGRLGPDSFRDAYEYLWEVAIPS